MRRRSERVFSWRQFYTLAKFFVLSENWRTFELWGKRSRLSPWKLWLQNVLIFALTGAMFFHYIYLQKNLLSQVLTIYNLVTLWAVIQTVNFALLFLFSEKDYKVLGYLPISDKTLLASKFASLFFSIMVYTVCIAFFSVLYISLKYFNILAFPVIIIFAFLDVFFFSMIVILILRIAFKIFGPRLIQHSSIKFQILFTLIVYVFLFLNFNWINKAASLGNSSLLSFIPSYWFTEGVVNLLSGKGNFQMLILSLLAPILMMWLVFHIFSSGYEKDIQIFLHSGTRPRRERINFSKTRRLPLLSPLTESLIALILAHLRYDSKLKGEVASMIWILAIPIILIFGHGWKEGHLLVSLLVMMQVSAFIALLFMYLVTESSYWRGSWVFFIAPLRHKSSLIFKMRAMISLLIVAPMIFLVAIIQAIYGKLFFTPEFYILYGAMTYFLLSIGNAIRTRLPFSMPPLPQFSVANFLLTSLICFVVFGFYLFYSLVLAKTIPPYGRWILVSIISLFITIIGWIIDQYWTAREAEALRYQG